MGLFSGLAKVGRAVGGAIGSVSRSPLGKVATSIIPGAGLVVGGLQLATAGQDVYSGLTGGGGGSSPGPMGLPALPGTAGAPSIVGQRGIFQNDPNVMEAIKPWAISKANLRVYYRSPLKGYVIVKDQVGDPMAVPKAMARKYFGWRPSAKPPISVTDWKAFRRAASVSKKLNKIHSDGQKYLTRKSSSSRKALPANYTIVESGPGSVKVGGRK